MSHVGRYFDRVLLTALGNPQVKRVEQVRREHDVTGRIGCMRYRLTLCNDDLIELTERVEVQAKEVVVTKYRHHWQNREGIPIKRWDNAPHHPQVASFPHHLHDGSEDHTERQGCIRIISCRTATRKERRDYEEG